MSLWAKSTLLLLEQKRRSQGVATASLQDSLLLRLVEKSQKRGHEAWQKGLQRSAHQADLVVAF
jgi:hypothetical protein